MGPSKKKRQRHGDKREKFETGNCESINERSNSLSDLRKFQKKKRESLFKKKKKKELGTSHAATQKRKRMFLKRP
jgi:hypothetical protein